MATIISGDACRMEIRVDDGYGRQASTCSWKIRSKDGGKTHHAVRWDPVTRLWTSMHRDVWIAHWGLVPDGYVVDHIDGNGLNNCFENLRLATITQNNANRRKLSSNKGKYKGVRNVGNGTFTAKITKNGVKTHLGTFQTEEDAARAYDAAAIACYGEFAAVNFPKTEPS